MLSYKSILNFPGVGSGVKFFDNDKKVLFSKKFDNLMVMLEDENE